MRKNPPRSVYVDYGFATSAVGSAVLIARIRRGSASQLIRVPFVRPPDGPTLERALGYEALASLLKALGDFGIRAGTIAVPDIDVLLDLNQHRPLPLSLHLPYIHLACLLKAQPMIALQPGSAAELADAALREVSKCAA